MEGKYYSKERNIQMLIYLLKAHNIKKIIASPGATNLSFVASVQQDSYFEIFSSVDERSAAYMACGLAAESGEPVVLTCTGATASRNYIPGLTEAYYRKLPVLAVTSTQDSSRIGHLSAQVIDRRHPLPDIALLSQHIPIVKDSSDEWDCVIKLNRALLELRHRGGGPVHINLTTTYSRDYSVKELPATRIIRRITQNDPFPDIPQGRIGIIAGAHCKWTQEETRVVDDFCSTYDAVVFCDHTSGYKGQYRVQFALVMMQEAAMSNLGRLDLLIHIGEVSGDYPSFCLITKSVWRVSEDGELRDTFKKLTHIFEMPERNFFEHYANLNCPSKKNSYWKACRTELESVRNRIPELPFSNTWIAAQTAHCLPVGSVLHLGILNTLRNWNLFEIPDTIQSAANTGGFGIDGILSSLIGASLADKNRIYYAILGDLAFFYDMNAAGNRHVASNVRILLINNGKGTEFRNYNHPGAAFGEDADFYIAAAGHYGNKSRSLVRHYAEDLGYEYLTACSKEEYLCVKERFLTPEITDRPMLLEVFTTSEDESEALKVISNIYVNTLGIVKKVAKNVLSEKGKEIAKKIIGKG